MLKFEFFVLKLVSFFDILLIFLSDSIAKSRGHLHSHFVTILVCLALVLFCETDIFVAHAFYLHQFTVL